MGISKFFSSFKRYMSIFFRMLSIQFSSVTKLCPTLCYPMDGRMPDFLVHHQHPELAQTHVNWVGDAIELSSSVVPFASYFHSFGESGFFSMSQFFTSGSQSVGASSSSSALPMNIQDWFPLGLMGLISLQSKGCSRVSSSTTVWKHQFFGTLPSH